MPRALRRPMPLAAACAAALALASCGGGSGSTSSSTPAATQAAKPSAPKRPLSARWYQDSDGDGAPDFVEQRLGYDPRGPDCLKNTGCDQRLVAEAARLADRDDNTMLLLDSSGSMSAPAQKGGGESKLTVAKDAIRQHVQSLPDAFKFGFEVFGNHGTNSASGKARSCRGVDVLAKPGELSKQSVSSTLDRFHPVGFTPLAAALRKVSSAFDGQEKAVNHVVVVTDGVETCGRDPVAAAKALHDSGVKVTVDVVGFDVGSADASNLRSIAQASGGTYTDAHTNADLDAYFAAQRKRFQQLNDAAKCMAAHANEITKCRATQEKRVSDFIAAAGGKASQEGKAAQGSALANLAAKVASQQGAANASGYDAESQALQKFVDKYLVGSTTTGAAYHPGAPSPCRRLTLELARGPAPGSPFA